MSPGRRSKVPFGGQLYLFTVPEDQVLAGLSRFAAFQAVRLGDAPLGEQAGLGMGVEFDLTDDAVTAFEAALPPAAVPDGIAQHLEGVGIF